MTRGRALELFFVEGDPQGMATAEVVNWTGHVLRVPRNAIKAALARPEADRTGVYLLRGYPEGALQLYVGESERIASRIKSHDIKKDWWDEAYFITTSSDALHKAHVKFLESSLVERARLTGKALLDNDTLPTKSSLSEAATSAMNEYMDFLDLALGALGVTDFTLESRQSRTEAPQGMPTLPDDKPMFYLQTSKHGVDGQAFLDGSDFVVRAGSKARAAWISKAAQSHSYSDLHQRLVRSGVLVVEGELAVFTTDYAFKSPSAAAAVLNGRSANGRQEWRTASGQKFTHWEADNLAEQS